MSQQKVQRVLIAGGGIGGLVAAVALQREGIAGRVFERVKKLEGGGAGLTLWANALSAFHIIGLTDLLETVGNPLKRSCILSWQGKILAETPVEALAKRFGTPLVAVHRADLQAALLAALGEGMVQTGTNCTGFQQDDTQVQAHLADGRNVSGDLLGNRHLVVEHLGFLNITTQPPAARRTLYTGVIPEIKHIGNPLS